MAQCSFCGCFDGSHDPICPSLTPQNSPERKRFEEGADIGAKDMMGTQLPSDPVAQLGYYRGQYLLEYRQNVSETDYQEA